MLFNTFDYLIFFIVIFVLYWVVTQRSLKLQNLMLVCASYYFYSCWNWRFVFLLGFSTLLDYLSGIIMEESKTERRKKIWLWVSVVVNLGILGAFKYFNFFNESFAALMGATGLQVNPLTIDVILPIGISFYTFHGLSYIIDVYKGRIKAERNLIDYALFVSFFPLLVAGPIERARHLLPQLKRRRFFRYDMAVDGLRQILWGLFKKIVIADNCAIYVNQIFGNSAELSGSTLVLGALLFAFQIYGDFSGYSDIALGTARILGINLLKNFNFPFFATNLADFWRRWHISLNKWFRDYVYEPLGGSRGGVWKGVRNTFIVFLLSGLWHGANWTFIVWGGLCALLMLPTLLQWKRPRLPNPRINASTGVVAKADFLHLFGKTGLIITFILVATIFFRAESLGHAFSYLNGIFDKSLFTVPSVRPYLVLVLIFGFMLVEWLGRNGNYGIDRIGKVPKLVRYPFYYLLLTMLFVFTREGEAYIYFQF